MIVEAGGGKSLLRHDFSKKSFTFKKNWLAIKYYFIKKYSKNPKKSLDILTHYANSLFGIQVPEKFYLPKNPDHFQNINLYLHRYKNYHKDLIKFLSKLDLKNEKELIRELSQRLKMKMNEVEVLLKKTTYKRILVTATMSAGKSTLVNTLVGKKVMATKNESCTAKKYTVKEDVTCGEYVYCYYPNTKLRFKKDIAELLHNISSEKVGIYSSMNHIEDSYLWEIIDTPGVNSSTDSDHKKISKKIIKSEDFDLMLYVMNGNHLGSKDDLKHLQFIKKNVQSEKIIFVINKVDQFRKSHDSVEESVSNVKKQLEAIGFIDPVIQPISAYAGYLLKVSSTNQVLNEEEQDELDLLIRKFERPSFDLTRFNSSPIQNANNFQKKLSRCGLYNLELLISRKEVNNA